MQSEHLQDQRMGKTSLVEEGLRGGLEADPQLVQSLLLVGINFHYETTID